MAKVQTDTAPREATFNIGDLIDLVAAAVPERTAIIWGDERLSYAELATRSDRLAAHFRRAGIERDMSVGIMLRNSLALVETIVALFKIGAILFNVNFRYVESELRHILADANAAGLIYDADLADVVDGATDPLNPLILRMTVDWDEDQSSAKRGVISYHAAVAEPVGDTDIETGRSAGDRLLIYTGGTTGAPKGVEWEQGELFFGALSSGATRAGGPITTPGELGVRAANGRHFTMLGAGPLIHGASVYGAFTVLTSGATLVLPRTRSFDAELVWQLVEREKVNSLSLMGDAMIRPMLTAWDANPSRWDISSLFSLGSGGGAMSEHTRLALAERFPKLMVMNAMGSSESGTLGVGEPAFGDGLIVLKPRPDMAVIADGTRFAEPGEMGILARAGHLPLGYWRDPAKTAATFVMVDGRRWVLTGDRAKIEENGNIRMYGRDSNVIHTGGEKVFAEEVEIAIRSHPLVDDAIVVGVPHVRWGQAIAAVVSPVTGATLTLEALRDHCAHQIARYKLPQVLALCAEVKRSPAGKADMRWAGSIIEAATEADVV